MKQKHLKVSENNIHRHMLKYLEIVIYTFIFPSYWQL